LTHRDSLLLPLYDKVKSSNFLQSMSFILTTNQLRARPRGKENSHGKLVELDQDFMPNSSIFKYRQPIRIHLLDLSRLGIRRQGGSMIVFLGVRVTESDSGSCGGSEAGGGVDCARG
jgi:hypothetical protein